MTKWYRLLDRTTPNGDVLRTETATIDGVTWWVGTIPPPSTVSPGGSAPSRPQQR